MALRPLQITYATKTAHGTKNTTKKQSNTVITAGCPAGVSVGNINREYWLELP
jgi:hypothetical protein